ncbi:MAG: hypothetical protein HY656_04130 [Acidobacteria bacterium]|nr:hypothetical protein [Acidobacteriota bacterium]
MPKGKPTPVQVDLYLRLYELRREAKLRAARAWFEKNFFIEKPEDVERIAPTGSEESAYFRMVVTYWEMVCALFNYGLLHEELFFETTGEQYMVWVRIQPAVAGWRQQFGDPKVGHNLEKAARRYEKWRERRAPGSMKRMREMLAAMAGQRRQA